MEPLAEITATISLAMGVAWASGINLYATVLMLGILANTGNIVLPADLQLVAAPMVMAAAGFMYLAEFFADKMPGIDTGWDAIHTFIRIPAGALLAAGAVGEVSAAAQLAAALIGGSISAGTHATKAGSRALINTSPEPFSNWAASVSEDILVIGGLWAALHYPILFLLLLAAFLLAIIWLLPKLWQGVRKMFHILGRILGNKDQASGPDQLE
jgi:hypothetical protein